MFSAIFSLPVQLSYCTTPGVGIGSGGDISKMLMFYVKVLFNGSSYLFPGTMNPPKRVLGPAVQSMVSLTSSLRGQLLKCFMSL